ncbi:hypothetical protein AGMMS50222_10460 [Endomicrobiia bacterium]|nr:hypothetical protein AGMMS50222_10460 [Endomicrobiia bacterium]
MCNGVVEFEVREDVDEAVVVVGVEVGEGDGVNKFLNGWICRASWS